MIRRFLIVLCLLSTAVSWAQTCGPISHKGLRFPSCGAVQLRRDTPSGPVKEWSREGLLFEFLPENYEYNAGGVAKWYNTGSYGGFASQSVEIYKPVTVPTNPNAFNPNGVPNPPLQNTLFFYTNGSVSLMDIAITSNIPRPGTWVIVGRFSRSYIVHGSGTGNQSRLDYRGSLQYTYYDGSGVSFYADNKWGVFIKTQSASGVHKMYKDGVLKDTKTGAIDTVYAPRLTLGDAAGTTPNAGFRGHFNAVLIYNRELSELEILAVEAALRKYIGNTNIEGKTYAEES